MAIKGGDPILEKQNWSTWFFGLCAFLFLCYGAVVYQEFVSRRTYIYYQSKFQAFDYDKTEKEFGEFKKTYDAAGEAPLKAAVDQATKAKDSAEYKKLAADRYDQFRRYVFTKNERAKTKSVQDALFYEWKHAQHQELRGEERAKEREYWTLDIQLHGDKSAAPPELAADIKKELGPGFVDWDTKVQAEQDKLYNAQKTGLDDKLAAYDDAIKSAEKALDDHRAPYAAYEDRLDKIKGRSVRTVDQIVNDRLGIGGAYTFGTVDRCRSCHVTIDKPGYDEAIFDKIGDKDDPLTKYKGYKTVFSTHPKADLFFTNHPVEQYGCTVCHAGQGRATRIKTASIFQSPDKDVFKVDMDQPHGPASEHGAHQWEEPLLRGDFMQSYCQRCHAPQRWLDEAPVYEKGKDLFLQKGCTGCHAVKGYEDQPRIGPELYRIKAKVTPEWMVSWIMNPKAFYPNTRMPMFVFDDYQVGAKDPKDNVSVMKHPEIQKDTATKIAAYLWQNSADEAPLPLGKFPGGGNVANGEKIIETVGCLGCHVKGDKGTGRAPPLDKAGAKIVSEDWIWNWIQDPRWHSATTVMPRLRLTPEEAKDVTAWLWQAGASERPKDDPALVKQLEDPANAKAGGNLIAAWGCFGCHAIKGHEKDGRIGPELTFFAEKKPFELAFGDTKVAEDWLDWTEGKLTNPRQYVDARAASRMPWMALAPDEVHALTVYLRGMKDPKVPEDMKKQFTGRAAKIERGRLLVNQYNCVGCHTIEGRGGLILPFTKDLAAKNDLIARQLQPPNLKTEGLKIQADFLLDFLKNPGGPNNATGPRIRPWLKIRMPTFPLTDEDRADIIAYFRAVDGIDDPYDVVNLAALDANKVGHGETLVQNPTSQHGLNCRACHVFKGQTPAGNSMENIAPDLANVWFRFRPDGVKVWLQAPQKAMPGTKMPGFFYDWDAKKDKSPNGPPSPQSLEVTWSTPDGKTPTQEEVDDHEIDAVRQYLFSLGKGATNQISMR